MVCVPKDMAKSMSEHEMWNSGNKELDGSNGKTPIELEINDVRSDDYPLNTFKKKGDNINLAIKSETELKRQKLLCTEYDMYTDGDSEIIPIKNECTINDDESTCEANLKCEYTDETCNYKSTDIKELINYSILKIYK
jgi:hypothetical protein